VSWEYDAGQGDVRAVVEISNDAWRLLGSLPQVEIVLGVRSGRLDHETASRESGELRRAVRPFIEWASANRSGDLAGFWRKGHLLRGADAAGALVRLLEAWREPVAVTPERGQP
jgi:hypothetical protein